MIRRIAFRYSESSYGHWLPLMLADRVSVVEGVLGDLKHGHVPNVLTTRIEHHKTSAISAKARRHQGCRGGSLA